MLIWFDRNDMRLRFTATTFDGSSLVDPVVMTLTLYADEEETDELFSGDVELASVTDNEYEIIVPMAEGDLLALPVRTRMKAVIEAEDGEDRTGRWEEWGVVQKRPIS